ncbi:MAG: DUF1549 domain-containing protein [Planctomycetota bacterium]|nr:DUF1549 domain-containing protein [Planctomycetota bacterium]
MRIRTTPAPSAPRRPTPGALLWFPLVCLTAASAVAREADETRGAGGGKLPPPARVDVDFDRDVRPIFSKRCFSCHGEKRSKGGLRLDVEELARRGGDSGVAFVPGRSAASRLIRYVAGLDEEIVMPPRGDRLGAEEVGLLRAWIDQGARWGGEASSDREKVATDHWAYRPAVRTLPPAVTRRDWPRTALDHFVLARLEAEGVEPSPPASREGLIRRLALDLLGLPPAPEEVDAFLRDERPDAYERLVDRLLASPRFGERWGRHWLDLARYADSDGYEKDRTRPHAWRYRDWVIDAVNRDQPFDRFSLEQLAGDLLPGAGIEEKVATGFHRGTLHNTEGGADPEEDRVKKTVDRVNTTSTVWMGLTMGCCQCHSHKYDQLTQREFYGLFAFFNSLDEVDVAAPLSWEEDEHRRRMAEFDRRRLEQEQRLERRAAALDPEQSAWEAALQGRRPEWSPLELLSLSSEAGAEFRALDDGSVLVEGDAPEKDVYTLTARTKLPAMTALRLVALAHDGLPEGGPGRAANGNFVLSEIELHVAPDGQPLEFAAARADHAQSGFDVARAIDGKGDTGWAISTKKGSTKKGSTKKGSTKKGATKKGATKKGSTKNGKLHRDRAAVFLLASPLEGSAGIPLVVRLRQGHGKRHTLGRFRLEATGADSRAVEVPAAIWQLLEIPAAKRGAEEERRVAAFHRRQDRRYAELQKALEKLRKSAPKPPGTRAQALVERAERRQTHIHERGDFLRQGDEVEPHTPAVLPALEPRGERPDRIDLVRWLFEPGHPLTGRVAVNRLWGHLFGRGLVASNDDFGVRGEPPSHPALLDWLATEFALEGWSRKALVREMVLSATYRQSSMRREDLVERDAENRLLARQARFRAAAEVVRDLHLAASGLLDGRIGGPGVRPPLPPGVAELGYAGSVKWPESVGADRYRRGLYIFFQRTVPYPMLVMFDAPDSTTTCPRRERSNTPLQALTLLNDPVFVESAQALARRALEWPGREDGPRVRRLFRLALGRGPDEPEAARLRLALTQFRELARGDGEGAARLVGSHRAPGVEATENAAWVALARVVLNLDEFITRE